MPNRLSIKALQAFEAAARHSSFAVAAEELYVSPSAISHQIKTLEEQVNAKLFHRIHRSVVLTDAGRRFSEDVSAAFAKIETAARNVSRFEKSDILTIHCAPSIAAQWLMPRLARFSARYPDIDVRVNASTGAMDLTSEATDVDIRYGFTRVQSSSILALPFPTETVVPLCSPALLEEKGPILKAEDLRQHQLIHSEWCLVSWRDWVAANKKVRLDIARGLRFDRSFMAVSAAVDGLGVCLESLLLVERELQSGRLIAPLGLQGIKVSGYTFNALKSRAMLPKIRWFQEWLFGELETSSAGNYLTTGHNASA